MEVSSLDSTQKTTPKGHATWSSLVAVAVLVAVVVVVVVEVVVVVVVVVVMVMGWCRQDVTTKCLSMTPHEMHLIMGAVSLWTRPPALYLCAGH